MFQEFTKGLFRKNPIFVIMVGLWAGIGFTLVMLLMSGVRERLDATKVPGAMKDIPLAFVCTGLMAAAFMGFSGMVR